MTGTTESTVMTVLRLRPAVHASAFAGGIHIRGWASSFTIEGGPGLWQLWQGLAARLGRGCTAEQVGRLSSRPEVREALRTLVEQLREHDMLMKVPPAWNDGHPGRPPEQVACWLEAMAPDPAAAWARMKDAEVTVTEGGMVAEAAVRALRAAGVPVRVRAGDGDTTLLLAACGSAVTAACDGSVGFVTSVGTAERARRDAEALAGRLSLVSGVPQRPDPVSALVGGAAALRVMCAVLGLPDPGDESAVDTAPGLPRYPMVLVAHLSPLRSEYRPWLYGDADARPPSDGGRLDLDEALDRIDAVCDPELGAVPAPDAEDLPQVPTGLTLCRVAGIVVGGMGVTSDAARLAAALGAAEHLASRSGAGVVACGVDRMHAEGVLLRRLVHHRLENGGGSVRSPLPEARGISDPVARRWWKTLTVRFGVAAEMRVHELAPGVYHAQVLSGSGMLGWAVEATAGDAAAFAALAAVGAAQWRATGRSVPDVMGVPCGAFPVPRADDSPAAPWHSDAWAWPGRAADREPALQERLSSMVPPRATRPTTPEDALTRALAAGGFVLINGGLS
ncbi:hypothetical protein [Streptosporangium sp. NPDC000396]|uniref:hypothetical protein n=1 Tax=Streptosporangium sp. NPDC000396 TaxID=3366185 RepID=UPI003678DB95